MFHNVLTVEYVLKMKKYTNAHYTAGIFVNFSLFIGSNSPSPLTQGARVKPWPPRARPRRRRRPHQPCAEMPEEDLSFWRKNWTILESPRAPLVGVLKGPARKIREEFSSVTNSWILSNLDTQKMLSSCFYVDHSNRNIDLNARHNSGWTAFRSML